ncbi:hypothetical protein MBLNU457_1584t1 [Dothideomycetes sp. NU457]
MVGYGYSWPIRPLPRNRLSSRLSPEVADTIVYPPNPPISTPLFSLPYGLNDVTEGRRLNGGHTHSSPAHCTCGHDHDDSEEEEEGAYDHPSYRWSSPTGADGPQPESLQNKLVDAAKGPLKPPPPPASTASSADGYESFENTSNKKKRKIPLSSSSGVHQSQLSAELANMGISSPGGTDGAADQVNGDAHAYSNGATGGTGIAGAGRGRYGRQSQPRERGRPTPHLAAQGYTSSLSAKSRGGNWRGDGTRTTPEQEQGIISAAIANAAEKPSTPPRGKENISLLSQQTPQPDAHTATPKTQFTFTCESDSSNKMAWPTHDGEVNGTPTPNSQVHHNSARPQPYISRNMPNQTAQGTQTAPLRASNVDPRMAAPGQALPPNPHAPVNGGPPPKPRRRRPSKEFAIAARQRKLQQEYNNFHHKPKKDDIWICEFCEYEDIFGMPPRALIRQYEIKDREERRKAEERRRLLEKAKMKKGRGKKGKGNKNAAQNPPRDNSQAYDPTLDNVPLPLDADGQGEEYYDDDYDDGYDSVHGVDSGEPGVPDGFHDYGPDMFQGQPGPPPAAPAA